MGILNLIVQKYPGLRSTYYNIRNSIGGYKKETTDSSTVTKVFEDIFSNNGWKGVESVSGRGSDSDQVKDLVEELPILFRELGIQSILDLPCGDFNWMKNIDLEGYNYIGADIVKQIIVNNNSTHARNGVEFRQIDLINDDLPKVDLILNRDCLIHFSNADVLKALKNVCRSGSRYFLTTTFMDLGYNKDIPTGRWRKLDLCAQPFNLPKPERSINENKNRSSYKDKTLSLWEVSAIARKLKV